MRRSRSSKKWRRTSRPTTRRSSEAAEKEFDKAVGQERREQLQQMAKDAQSGDPKKQEAARQKLDEMMKNAGKGARGSSQSPEEMQKWADKAKT